MPHTFDPPFHSVFFYDPVPQYDPTVEGRPALLDVPRAYEGDDHTKRVERLRLFVLQWAKEDAERTPATRPRGRPRTAQALPGEDEAARRTRLNREAQQRWRERHGHKLPAGTVVMDREQVRQLMIWTIAQRDGTGNDPTESEVLEALRAAGVETAVNPRPA